MKRTLMSGFVVALVLAIGSLYAADDKKASVLFQAAEAKAIVQGDLRGAIALYEQAVKEAGSNRALAAKALLRMAECYQKLGDAQAKRVYERLVREYADQKEAVTVARARLETVARASSGSILARQVWTGPKGGGGILGSVSPDGRYVSGTDWETGDLLLHDVFSGRDQRLTNKGTWLDSNEYTSRQRRRPRLGTRWRVPALRQRPHRLHGRVGP